MPKDRLKTYIEDDHQELAISEWKQEVTEFLVLKLDQMLQILNRSGDKRKKEVRPKRTKRRKKKLTELPSQSGKSNG